jgi:serine kinase of HPr protein (carbohydrate metabolism regulator)
MSAVRLHATCVVIDAAGGEACVLLTGPSGSGKSDLGLRLIDRGARLIADDQVLVEARGGRLYARAPEAIRGRIEVRGVGVVAVAWQEEAELRLQIALGGLPVRLPEPSFARISGIALPHLTLTGFEASATAKVRQAVVAILAGPQPGVTFPFAPQ